MNKKCIRLTNAFDRHLEVVSDRSNMETRNVVQK
jgi:hypothetical protein